MAKGRIKTITVLILVGAVALAALLAGRGGEAGLSLIHI